MNQVTTGINGKIRLISYNYSEDVNLIMLTYELLFKRTKIFGISASGEFLVC